jgi:transposase
VVVLCPCLQAAWRGVATRYDKYALTYLGDVTLAAIVTHHRTHLPDTT